MGDTQSAYEEGERGQDAAECGVQDVQHADDEKLLNNEGLIAAKSDTSFMEVNGRCEDDTKAEADGLETLRENIVVIEEESIKEANNEEDISFDVTEVEAKHNITESFKTFLSKVGLKFTLKRGPRVYGGNQEDGPDGSKSIADQIHDDKTQADAAHESQNEDSTHPTEEEATVRQDSQNEADITDKDWTHLDTPSEQDLSSLSCAKEDVTIQRFFTTGLAKKRMSLEDETMTRELVLQEAGDTVKETTQDEQEDTEIIAVTLADGDQAENPSAGMKREPETPKEIECVPSSPLKRLLLGSSLMMLKRQKDAKPSEGEDCKPSSDDSEQLFSSTDMAENDKTQRPAQPTETTVAGQEESPWAAFMKLLSPKKRVNRSALNNDDVQTPKPREEDDTLQCRLGDGKDSAVSWDAILCARSQTPSDSDHEIPNDDVNAEEAIENYDNNADVLASTPKEAASPPEGNVESAWTVFKRLMSPKRKAKPAGERQRSREPDGHQDNSFSAQIIPGCKKRKSVSNKDQQTSLCEVDQELGAGDLNSEMPAALPLSNRDTAETEPKESVVEEEPATKTDADLNQDIVPQVTEAVQLLDNPHTEGNEATNEDLEFNGNALSDIPEEGEITESTKADNLIESTSEAVTAPSYPVDMSLAEDSEKISALSQQSEQTSGATTAVVVAPDDEITPPIPPKELAPQEIAATISTEELDTKEVTILIPTKELDNEEMAPQILTKELDIKEIKSLIPIKELGTQEITPQFSQKFDTQEITTHTPTEDLDIKEITAAFPAQELEAQEITPPIPTEEFDTKEIKTLIHTEELHIEEITPTCTETEKTTPSIPIKELDIDEIKLPILTEGLNTEEIIPTMTTWTISTLIQTEDLNTKEITCPVPPEELDTQVITAPISTEKPDIEEIKTQITTEKFDIEEITPATRTEEPDTEEITPSIPSNELWIEEIKYPITSEELNTDTLMTTEKIRTPIQTDELNTKEITPHILQEDLDTQEMAPPIPTEELKLKESTTAICDKELETQEITPPIPAEELGTKEIQTKILTEEFDLKDITPCDTEEMTPSIPNKDLEIKEIKSPVPTEELDTHTTTTTGNIRTPIQTKEITPLVLKEEFDTQERARPIPTEELDTQEISPPIPSVELDMEESSTPSPTKAQDTEEITPPLPTETPNTEEITPPISSENLHSNDITSAILIEELATEDIRAPTPTEEYDTEEITPPIPIIQGLKMEKIQTPFFPEELDTDKITTLIPTAGLNAEEFTPELPIQELHTKEITPLIPTQETDKEVIMPSIPTDKSDTEEMTPSIPTMELILEACAPPIPTEDIESKEISSPVLTEEVDTTGISPSIPSEDVDREESIAPIATEEKFNSEKIIPQVDTEELDTEELTTDETKETNLSKSDDYVNELDSIDAIREFVECLADINQGESLEQLSESKDVGPEDDLEDLATNQGENKASEVDSQQPLSMAEHERRDGGKRYLVESAKQPQVKYHIPVVDELQRSSDILDDTTNLHEGVTAESIIDAPEPETIDDTDLKETDPQQNTLHAVTIHLEEQKVKVTSQNFPAAFTEDLEPTTEILSELILNSVDVSGVQTEALALQQGSVQLDKDEMLSDKVVSEFKEMTELLTDVSMEPENKDVTKEPVETSTDETEAVQATSLVSEKGKADKKKTVAGLPEVEDKAMFAPEIEFIQEQQVIVATPKIQFESEIADVQHDELKEDIHGEDPSGEEVKDDNVPLPETDAEETAKDQKTINDTQIKFVREDKDIEGRDLSVKAEDISESILAQETLIAEVKYTLTEDELVSADQQAKSDISPEQEVVQETCAKSDEDKEVREDIHPLKNTTEECGEVMAPQLQTIIDSAKDDEVAVGASEIERGKEIEETQSKQSIQTNSVVAEETINTEIQMTEELKEETMRLAEVQAESNQKAVDVVKTELNPDQIIAEEGKATMEDIADERNVSVEVKEEALALSEMNVDPQEKDNKAVNETDNIKMSEVLASEEANVELLQSEETTEGILEEESLPSELKEGAEPMSELTLQPGNINMKQVTVLTEGTLAKKSDDNQNEAMKSSAETEALLAVRDEVHEPEEVPAVETETAEEVATPGLEITQQRITRTLSKETLEEEIPKPETEREIVSEVEQTKPPLDQALDKQKNLEPEITADDRPQDAKEGEEDGTPQVTEAHTFLHQEEKNCAQTLENVIFEEIPEVCGTLADKVKLEARASDVENRTTGENCDLPNVEATNATGEYALVTQVTMCRFKEVSTALPNRIRTPSCMQEPLMGSVVPESTETAVNESPMMTDDLAEMARIRNEAVMMYVPATAMEANHSIQVQVVQMDTTTAERSLDQMSEIGIREKAVIDIGNRNIEGVEFLSASLGVEDVMHEDYAVMCHEIVPHVKENHLETLGQTVLKEARDVSLGKIDGNMELIDREHACIGETLEEALHEEATPQRFEVPKFQELLEEKEDSIWALQAEESMAATDQADKARVAKEEPCTPKDSHKDTEPTKEGPQTFVVQSSFHQMEPGDNQKEKNPTEEGVQLQEALSQTDLGEYQDIMTNEEDFQIPKVEEPLSQIDTEEHLSLLDPLASLKTTEQSEVSEQAILALDSVVSVDNHKQTGISEENVKVQQTVKPSFPKEPDGKQKSAALTKKSCQKPKAKEPVFQKESPKDQKQTDLLEKRVQARKNQEPLTQKESTDTQKQVELQEQQVPATENQEIREKQKETELREKHVQASKNQEPLPQKESAEIQKQTELQDKYFQPSETQESILQEESTEVHEQTELREKHIEPSKAQEPLPQTESTETQKPVELTEEHDQARDIQVLSPQNEPTETQKQTELLEKHRQEIENQEPLPENESTEIRKQTEVREQCFQTSETQDTISQKESTETQTQMEVTEEHEQASETQEPIAQKESNETQKQMKLTEEHEQAGDVQVPSPQKESTENQKQMELLEKCDQTRENQDSVPQKELNKTQKQTEQTKEAPEKEMVSLPKEPVNGQKQAVRPEETFKLVQELKSTDISVTTGSSVHLDSGFLTVETEGAAEEILPMLTVKVIEEIQSAESIEPVEKYAATAEETPNVQTSETLQTAERPETEAPIKEAEEEKDIWMDAKEDIEIPGETNVLSPQDASPRHDLNRRTKTLHEAESEPMPDTDSGAESESEGDNFDIAFDNSKLESAGVMEGD